MKRMKVLFGNRRMMVLITLAILVLAAAALVASSASFTASSTNLSNTFTTGNLTMDNGTFTINTGKLMPGHSLAGTIAVKATADGGTASLWMKRTGLTGTATAALLTKLTLTVTESHSTNGGSTWSAAAPITGYPTAALNDTTIATGNGVKVATVGDLAAGTMYQFTMTVNFPDGGIPTSPTTEDNAFKNMTAIPAYTLTAISD